VFSRCAGCHADHGPGTINAVHRLGIALLAVASLAAGCGSSSSATTEPAPPTTSAPGEQATSEAHASYTRCDQNISAGPHTTCGFADNVFRAFARDVSGDESEPGDADVQASSPATGKTYSMQCHTSGGETVCSGQTARVRFPLWAAEVYYKPTSTPESSSRPDEEPETESPERGEAEPSEPGSECTNGTYENSAGNIICKPEESPTQPAGATARCEDGTFSFSESRSGTCSHHGGVSEWLE
jgi:hypothetical protein